MGHPITEPIDMAALEREFAYLHASGVIDSSCLFADDDDLWLDVANTMDSTGEPMDISEEVDYLDARRLILRHPSHPNWVQILDEAEPLPQVTQ